ncbi:MAG TPA: hypothetical protein VKX49_07220 [Bryobacteraceae bacterium]|nr:hypothetical protein [Bryobacteraceae bacterium]
MLTRIAIAALAITIPARSGFMKFWQLPETEKAPILVTGEVISVRQDGSAPERSAASNHDVRRMTAEVRVLRSRVPPALQIPQQIQVQFFEYAPPLQMSNGSPPPLANLKPGEVAILPLSLNEDASQPWKLLADEGVNATVPARAELPESDPVPTTARMFILRELANALAHGTPSEVFAACRYIETQQTGVAGGLIPVIEPEIGDNRDRWAEIATSAMASTGVPRPTFADLFAPETTPTRRPGSQALLLVQTALRHLQPSLETDALLIETMIEDAPVHAWGSANSLLEFADDPILTNTLRRALKENASGTSYIAWTLAHNGHKAVLDDALDRALRVCDQPTSDRTDLEGAAALLRDFGSDRQLDRLAALVRKYQTFDRDFYSVLWQYSAEASSPREVRVLSVVLNDREPLFNGMRVCDFAVGILERAIGEDFHSQSKSSDDTVARARAWLDAHGIRR